mmetsp:Transcript_36303/g.84444  ORF Transcript_36303/g.84444 Transcript_36303/m.84444 type:complete len:201 (+) Transcript_36303:264-866(+)
MFSGLASINTSETRSFTHSLTWGINLAVMTNILQFSFTKTYRARKGIPFCRKWGPFNCIFLAMLLMMADLTRHLVNDVWGTECIGLDRKEFPDSVVGVRTSSTGDFQTVGNDFNKYCRPVQMANEYNADHSLSVWGWSMTIFCTWSGFALLFVGICWLLNLPGKVARQWRAIRRGQTRGQAASRQGTGRTGREPLVDNVV